MTREEAIKYLIRPTATSTSINGETAKQFEAYDMAIEALQFADKSPRTVKLTEDIKITLDEEAYEIGYTHGQMADRPQGEWIFKDDDVKCSLCGSSALMRYIFEKEVGLQEYSNYCPNCGAYMGGKE